MDPFNPTTSPTAPAPVPAMPAPASKKSHATLYAVLILALLILVALVWWMSTPAIAPSPEGSPAPDASDLDAEISALEEVDLDAEFQEFDSELNQL